MLTARGQQVLQAAAEGLTVDGTARRLYITADTVKAHRRRILRTLGATNITHAVAITRTRLVEQDDAA
jgi:DNA-binding NarL/FixJ family response regulator